MDRWSSTSATRTCGWASEAVVFGPGDAGEPTVADWAGWSDTLEHEVVTGLGGRVHRAVAGTRVGLRSLA